MKLCHKVIIFFILCILGISVTNAQQDSTRHSFGETLTSDVKMIFTDAGTIFTAPVRFSERDWLITGAVVGGTAALFSLDQSARSLAQRNQSQFGDNLFNIGREYGRPIYGIVLSSGLYLGGLAFDKKDVRLTGVMVFESLAFAGAITTVIKSVAGRSRPFLEEGNTRFRGFQFRDGTTSLPSGHATVAFAVSSVLAARIHNTLATVGLYSLATLTAVSRVYHDEHWASDSFLGAAIGTVVGLAVVDIHDHRDNQAYFRFIPSINGIRAELIF